MSGDDYDDWNWRSRERWKRTAYGMFFPVLFIGLWIYSAAR